MENRPAKILIIDDDPLFLKIMSEAFEENGFAVTTAADGITGIRAFLDHSPDVVISDLIMPNIGGVSTCLEIVRLAGDKVPIMILMTSMFRGEPHEHQLPDMGARIHIPKSTQPLDVVIIVEQLIYRRSLERASS
ncbi:MAG TPA: response regulator [Geobacteraceae bacterium]|nr:response regulator [Geobacteraceae bacterium]